MCKHIVLCGNPEELIKKLFLSVFPDAVFEKIPDSSKNRIILQQKCDILILDISKEKKTALTPSLYSLLLERETQKTQLVILHDAEEGSELHTKVAGLKADIYVRTPFDSLTLLSQITLLSRIRESKIFENEQRFRLLFENAPIAYQSLNSERRIIDVNPAWEKMTGYSKAEVLGKRMSEFMPKEQIPVMQKQFQKFIEEGQVCSMEFKLITKSKKTIVVSLEGKTVTDNEGNFIQTQCILHNITEKKKQENALRESEMKFRSLAENVPGTIFICALDKAFSMLYLNDQAEVLTGYPKSSLLKKGNDFSKHIHKEDKDRVYNEVMASINKKENYVIQYRILHRDGSIRWVEEMGTGIFKDGILLNLQGFILDITEKKETRDALTESQKILRNVLDTVPVRVFYKDLHLRFLGCNKPFVMDTGLSDPEEIVGKNDFDMSWINEAELYRADDMQVIKTGKAKINYEEPQTSPDGKIKHLRTSKIPLKNNNGETIGVLGTYEDITAQKVIQQTLEESEEKYRLLVDNLNDLVVKVDLKGQFLYVSPSYCRMFGKKEKELIGQKFMPFVHKEDQASTMEALQKVIKPPHYVYFEQRAITKDGWKWLAWSDTAVLDASGNVKEIIGVGRDISKQKGLQEDLIKAKEKAEENNKLKTAFLNNLSHEVRTPLNAIVGFSSFLKNDSLSPERRQYYADLVIKSSEQLLSIINDIIIISTIKTGQTTLFEKECNLNSMLQDVYEQVSLGIDNPNLSVSLKLSDEEVTVFTDRTKLIQIITNLLNNAIKFTLHGDITFGYKKKKHTIEFYVSDTGIGIKEEHQDMIFEPFRQGDASLDRAYGGTGLGLSIAKSFVNLLGGDIRVQSKEGEGSVFYFTIPNKQS